MMKNYFLGLAMIASLAACGDDDEDIVVRDVVEDITTVDVPDVAYRRVDRMAIPAVTSGLLVTDAEKDAYNSGSPETDLAVFGATALERVSLIQRDVIPALGIDAEPDGSVLATALANGDVLQIDPNVAGTDPVVLQDPNALLANGRMPGTDIIDLLLTIVATNTVGYAVSDGVDANDKPIPATFPYLAQPQ